MREVFLEHGKDLVAAAAVAFAAVAAAAAALHEIGRTFAFMGVKENHPSCRWHAPRLKPQ